MMMHLLVLDEYFDATFEEIIDVISDYLDSSVKVNPNMVLGVSVSKDKGKKIWKGEFLETHKLPLTLNEWGTDDISYGYIEIIQDTPIRVKLYCSYDRYIAYWSGLSYTLRKRHKVLAIV